MPLSIATKLRIRKSKIFLTLRRDFNTVSLPPDILPTFD